MDPQIDILLNPPLTAIPVGIATVEPEYSCPLTMSRYCGNLTNWQRRKVTQYIEENLSKVIRIEDLAEMTHLSYGYFTTIFKMDFGKSPYQYIISRRLEMAKSLLRETRSSLCDVAMDCGLSDQAHLCNLFRRHLGTTPRKWRARAKAALSLPVPEPSVG